MVPFRLFTHSFLKKPDMELELELSLIFRQKHSEKQSANLPTFDGFVCALQRTKPRRFVESWRSPGVVINSKITRSREPCHIPNGKLGKSSTQTYHGLGIWGYVSFEEGY